MSRPDSANNDQLVDQLADRFEAAWRAGERPTIESFLESTQASSRLRLLTELIKIEFELRQQAGDVPQADEYRRRFPSMITEVEEFFSQIDSSIMATTTIAAGTTPARGQLLIRLNCPHCQNPIQVVEDESVENLLCPSCGSSFKLDHDRTQSWKPEKLPRLGRYQLLEAVGRGAFGTVYRAQDTELSRIVAIKVPRTGQLVTRDEEDRFVREARSVAQLHHPSIVPVYEIGRSDSFPYIVSRFVDGVTLADSLTAKDWEPCAAAELIAAVAEALECAHQQGVIHRDVKPSNIMLDQQGHSYLMDFGLARRDAGEVTVTTDGQVLGTPAYMSPEQARGEAHRVDGRSDVYSLGVILYQLLVGELPFRGNTRMLLQQVLHDEPRAPRSRKPSVPRDLDTICLKALAKEPQQRYQSAGEIAADLRRYMAGEPILARRSGLLARSWRWAKRHRIALTMAILFVGWVATVTIMLATNNTELTRSALSTSSTNKEPSSSDEPAQSSSDIVRPYGELMFIFDCSGSMSEPTPEGPRIDVARKVLLDGETGVLNRLAGERFYHVGVRFYGHRVGWDQANPLLVRRREDLMSQLSMNSANRTSFTDFERLRPGNDVERILPVGEFWKDELRRLDRVFSQLQPWGITPLYYAIAKSLEEDFSSNSTASVRRIVVLSDGSDQQDQDRGLDASERVNLATLRALFESRRRVRPTEPIQLDIVGFQVAESPELHELAKSTGGQFYKADERIQLLHQLEESFDLGSLK